MKLIVLLTACTLLCSCYGTKMYFANRSTFNETELEATTNAQVAFKPTSGAQSVAAEKTTDLNTAVSTSSGSAVAEKPAEKKEEEEKDPVSKSAGEAGVAAAEDAGKAASDGKPAVADKPSAE